MDYSHSKPGFTLIEMLITVFISSLVMVVLMRLYLSTAEQTQLSNRIQERALQRQLLMTLFQQDFHNAGFFGCAGPLDPKIALEINPKQLPLSIRKNKVPDSDVIALRQLEPVTTVNELPEKELWIVNCAGFERLKVSHEVIPLDSLIGYIETVYWYVRTTPFLKPNSSKGTALTRQASDAPSEDIVDDVHSLKITRDDNQVNFQILWDNPSQSQALQFALLNR